MCIVLYETNPHDVDKENDRQTYYKLNTEKLTYQTKNPNRPL